MSPLAREVHDAAHRLAVGERGILLTIEATAGSAPRDAGTAMLIFAENCVGTIGGGALEHAAINRARAALDGQASLPDIETIPLGPAIGQCCGGSVVLRYRSQDEGDHAAAREWLARIDGASDDGGGLWLFGAGHVGKAVIQAIGPLGFPVTWIDSRPEIFPDTAWDVETLVSRAPHLEIAKARPGAMVLVMTHSHAQDFDIIDTALKRADLGLVGLIGSATKRARFIARLKARDHSEHVIGRLICPIGISGITGKEPSIIAASISAQLLIHRETTRAESQPPISMAG
jgi:xanthine dehydrogenase accessory factor